MSHDIKNGLDAGFSRYLTIAVVVNKFMDALDAALEFSAAGTGHTE